MSPSGYLGFCKPCDKPASFYTKGRELLEGPIQKLPEDTATKVMGKGGGLGGWEGCYSVKDGGWCVRQQGPKVYVPL